MRYAHTNIIAQDWRALAAFYTTVFDCQAVPPERRQSGEWLSRGTGVENAALEGGHLLLPGHGDSGPTLEIFSYTSMVAAEPGPANRIGLRHLAFEVASVSKVAERVIEAGGSLAGAVVERTIPNLGILCFVYVRDPEGNLIELQSWRPES